MSSRYQEIYSATVFMRELEEKRRFEGFEDLAWDEYMDARFLSHEKSHPRDLESGKT